MSRHFCFEFVNETVDSTIAFYPILTQPLSIKILTIIYPTNMAYNDRFIPLLCYFDS